MVAQTNISPTSGARLWIGPAADSPPADVTTAAALTYTRVRKTETFGAFGDAAQPVTFDATDEERRIKVKGTRDAGDWSVTVGRVPGDAGQIAMQAAEQTDQNFVFKLVMDDEPVGGTKPTTFYLYGMVTGARVNPGGANNVTRIEYTIALNAAPIEDPAA